MHALASAEPTGLPNNLCFRTRILDITMPSHWCHVEPQTIENLQTCLQARELAFKAMELAVKQGQGKTGRNAEMLEELKSSIQFNIAAISYLKRRGEDSEF